MNERRETREEEKGQAVIEFTFCMIIIFLMIYAIMMVLRWTGKDLAERRIAHEETLRTEIHQDYGGCVSYGAEVCDGDGICSTPCLAESTFADGPIKQIAPYFYTPIKMNAVWGEQ
jgi:hypothetical protein